MNEIDTFVPHPPVPILIVICGSTATGKSSLGLALALKLQEVSPGNLQGAILSADSRQVYREFDIGTAKPALAEQQRILHYLIDICAPTETLTLAEYQQRAQTLIAELHGQFCSIRQKAESRKQENSTSDRPQPSAPKTQSPKLLPILVGGTGLYVRSIVRGLRLPKVAPQLELRSQLQSIGQSQCYAFLQQVDPVSAEKIHPNDTVRTLRALEVFYVTGKPISRQQGECPPVYPILQIGLDCLNPAQLIQRIEQRTAQMMADGFVEETKALCQKYGTDLPLLNTLGYQEIKQYLAGEISLAEAERLIVLHTRQFAKQQRTWFRADPSIHWFDADDPNLLKQVWHCLEEFLESVL